MFLTAHCAISEVLCSLKRHSRRLRACAEHSNMIHKFTGDMGQKRQPRIQERVHVCLMSTVTSPMAYEAVPITKTHLLLDLSACLNF
uniref:Uncharacterized protein n=1 Tax=Arundo donax TaxID=35708 RepID=A0A0A9FGX8_ARUDO